MTDQDVSGGNAVDKPKTDFVIEGNQPVKEDAPKAESTNAEPENKPEDQKDQKKPRKGGWQRKIEALEAENAELRKQPAVKPEPKESKPEADGKPKPESFTTWDDYNEALIDWKADQKVTKAIEENSKKTEAEAKTAKAKEQRNSQIERYEDGVERVRQSNPDFDQIIDAYDGPLTVEMQDALLDSEMGPEVALHLAKPENRDLAENISQMTVAGMLRAIGKIEAQLEVNTVQAVKTTKSPPPINPVKPKSSGSSLEYKEGMEYEDFKKMRQAQKRR